MGGVQLSLLELIRFKLRQLLDNRYVYGLILGMTLFLCVVILSELSLSEHINDLEGNRTTLGNIYFILNYILLAFFVLEIALKLFARGMEFLADNINLFDSTVVLVSFYFQVSDQKVSFVSLLRILRLIKVMTEMKKVADAKKRR